MIFSNFFIGAPHKVDFIKNQKIIESFRYKVYITELKKQLPHADHQNLRLPDNHDITGHHFMCTHGIVRKSITGYIRLHLDEDFQMSSLKNLCTEKLILKF